MITLYDCSTAPSPRRARILLAEKAVPHATVQVDLRSGEQLGEAYRRINPQCTGPALRTQEGLLLTDNAAIAAYAEARWPEPPLMGTTLAERVEVRRLLAWFDEKFDTEVTRNLTGEKYLKRMSNRGQPDAAHLHDRFTGGQPQLSSWHSASMSRAIPPALCRAPLRSGRRSDLTPQPPLRFRHDA